MRAIRDLVEAAERIDVRNEAAAVVEYGVCIGFGLWRLKKALAKIKAEGPLLWVCLEDAQDCEMAGECVYQSDLCQHAIPLILGLEEEPTI